MSQQQRITLGEERAARMRHKIMSAGNGVRGRRRGGYRKGEGGGHTRKRNF